ncbi:Osmotin thaumatin-like protein [Hysterangium stoloniferum]|nr:Osmotin thaumatin-like protein [Hysterangium stoloniferum]
MSRLIFVGILVTLLNHTMAASLNIVNKCNQQVFLFTQSSSGTIANNVVVGAGATRNMGISANWNGAVNVGTGCGNNPNACATGGPVWDGRTPFSRAELNWAGIPGKVVYDISLIYGYNVGMAISGSGAGCAQYACTLPGGCPVPGPGGSCFSGCCSSAGACSNGALPPGGGGCPNNGFAGPHSSFYFNNCPNAYAFPFNDGANGGTPANNVVSVCSSTDITVTLCPGTTSHIPK